jgi:hypothetical protein
MSAPGTLFTFGGTTQGSIQLEKLILNNTGTNVFAYKFDTATTFGSSVSNHNGTITDKTKPFTSSSYTQQSPGFKFNNVGNISSSTISLAARSEGNTSTYTTIRGTSYKTLATTGISFTSKLPERMSVAADGTITYSGLEDVTLALDANVNCDPQTATKNLRAQPGVIKVSKRTVTFTNATDVINETATPRANGDTIVFKNTAGTLPTGLDKDEVYYVVGKATDSFQVSHTLGGAATLFTDDGSGTNSYQLIDMSGSIGRASITAAGPIDLVSQALCSMSTGDTINMFVWNDDDAVDILVRNIYMRVRE